MASFKITGDWKKFQDLVKSRKFQGRLRSEIRRATELNALLARNEMRRNIKEGRFKGNARLTTLLKKSRKALFNHGDLMNGITHRMMSDHEAIIGVMRGAISSIGELVDLVEIIENGSTIKVTPAMRGMFFYLWRAGQGEIPRSQLTGRAAEIAEGLSGRRLSQIRPLKASTQEIVIPARPFIRRTMKSRKLRKEMKRNWERAIQRALEGKKGGGGNFPQGVS